MKIGFDAKRVFANATGLGHYSRTLISALAVFYPQHKYYLFAPEQTPLFDATAYENIQIETPRRFPSTLFTSIWRSSWVKQDLRRLGIDVYHGLSHEIPAGIGHLKLKTVVTIHDLIFERYPHQYPFADRMIYRKKFRHACTHANRIIAISEQTKSDLVDLYRQPAEKIEVCYQSCDASFAMAVSEAEKAAVKLRYRLPEEFFLYVGSIIERKNLLAICKAMLLLKGSLAIPLVVIGQGGGRYKQEVLAFIAHHKMQQQIIFLNDDPAIAAIPSFRNSHDLPAIYQQAQALIYPSYFEGFGIPVLEALNSGLPVITSAVSSLPEAGGDAALYINPGDAQALAGAMKTITSDRMLRDTMRQKGYRHAANFTPQHCAAKVMEVYNQLYHGKF